MEKNKSYKIVGSDNIMKSIASIGAAALLTAQLFSSTPQTYQGSIDAKKSLSCVPRKYPDNIKFDDETKKIRYKIQLILYSDRTDGQKLSEMLELPAAYGACKALYSMWIPGSQRYQELSGRQKPPLTGTYEEQARTAVREIRKEIDFFEAGQKKRQIDASKVIRDVSQVISALGRLPDPVSADISVDNWGMEGRIWPKFSRNYGEQGTIVVHKTGARPPDSAPVKGEDGFYKGVRDNGYTMLLSGEAYTSYSLESLKKMRDGEGVNLAERGEFGEFSKFISRIGPSFDGTARFRAGSFSSWPVSYNYYSFNGTSGSRNLAAAAYYNFLDGGLIAYDMDENMLAHTGSSFGEVSIGGQRQVLHVTTPVHLLKHPSWVRDVRGSSNFILFLEEKK